jgi:protein involved in polysaccharide export with SLBB domain
MRVLSRVLLFAVLLSTIAVTSPAMAQTAAQMSQIDVIRQELTKRGLTEDEVRVGLIKRGIILENIPPNELSRYQTQIMEVIAELEAAKRAAAASGTSATDPKDPKSRTGKEGEEDDEEADSLKTPEIKIPDIFGHAFFLDGSLRAYRTTDAALAPESYVLGSGDKVRVVIFGASQADLNLEVNAEGFVSPSQMPKIFLQGLTLSQARDVLRQRFSNAYTFRQDQIAITIQTTRTVSVQVLGEARRRGMYAVSPMNSAFNALALAGGIDSIGTVRRIEWIRGTTRKRLDTYAMISDPTLVTMLDLQSNDIIHIPVAGPLVRVEGAVRRPMRYELIPGETLVDLITFAGGFADDANPDVIQVQRFENGQSILIETRIEDNFPLRAGDIVRVRKNDIKVASKVGVGGAVYYPGSFGYRDGLTVGDVIQLAGGLLPSANERAYLERRELRDTTKVNYLLIDLGDPESLTFPMIPNDNLSIYDRTLYSNVGEVGVSGAVKQFVRLTYSPDLTIADLIHQAGGVVTGAALNRVQVFRTNIYPEKPSELIDLVIKLDKEYNVIEPTNFRLQPYDEIVVRLTPGFELRRTVDINGEVNFPGSYTLESRQLHLSDLIKKAGGLRDQADPIGATLFREYGDRGFIVTDLRQVLRHPRSASFDPILMAGDVITINRLENTVTITGEGVRLGLAVSDSLLGDAKVNVTYQGKKDAKWYINNYAGGFEERANKRTVTVTLKNGQVLATRRFLLWNRYPQVETGSVINVSLKPEVEKTDEKKVDWDTLYNRTLQSTTTLLTMLILIRQL